jgi:ribosomal protein L24E
MFHNDLLIKVFKDNPILYKCSHNIFLRNMPPKVDWIDVYNVILHLNLEKKKSSLA